MHLLHREGVKIPTCLSFKQLGRTFPQLSSAEKREIRDALLNLQKQRCAYCERRTGAESNQGHIEHFLKQETHSALDMDWSNLFWSCLDEDTCGKHKDKCDKHSGRRAKFSPPDLIKPDADNPDIYFAFVSDGTIRLRDNLDPNERRRAEETLRIFQLNDSPFLRKSREDAVKPYIEFIKSLTPFGRDVVENYARTAIEQTETLPFVTPVRQFLEAFLG